MSISDSDICLSLATLNYQNVETFSHDIHSLKKVPTGVSNCYILSLLFLKFVINPIDKTPIWIVFGGWDWNCAKPANRSLAKASDKWKSGYSIG